MPPIKMTQHLDTFLSECRPAGWTATAVQTEICPQLFDGLPWNFAEPFMVLRGWIAMTLVMSPLSVPRHHEVHIYGFQWSILTTIGWIAIELDTIHPKGTYIYVTTLVILTVHPVPSSGWKCHFVQYSGLWPNTCILVLISKCHHAKTLN